MKRTLECVLLPTGNNPEDIWSSHQHNVTPEYYTGKGYSDLELSERTRIVIHTPYQDPKQTLEAFKEAHQHVFCKEMEFSNSRRRMLASIIPFALTIPTCIANGTETVNNYFNNLSSYYGDGVLYYVCNFGLRVLPFILTGIPIYIFENIRELPGRGRLIDLNDFFQNLDENRISTVHSGLIEACLEVHKRVEPRPRGQFWIPQEDMQKLKLHRGDQPDIVLHAMYENRYWVNKSLGHLYEKFGAQKPIPPEEYEKYVKKKED